MLSLLQFKDKIYYGWVVVAAFFAIGVTLYGIHLSFGVFFKSIESEFNLTRAATSAILSTNLLLAGICAFFAGWALDRYGPKIVILLMGLFTGLSLVLTSQTNSVWQLFITYSLLLAMGTGAVYVVPMSAVSRWFGKQRGLALGIAGAGIGLGMAVVAPLATYLITNFNWQMSYLIIGLIAWLVVIPLSRFLKKDPHEVGTLPDGAKSVDIKTVENYVPTSTLSLIQAFRTRSFWLLLFNWFLFAANTFFVMTHVVPHITDIGFSAAQAATVLSLVGGSALVGRVLMGIIADRIGRKVTAISCVLLQAGAMMWLIWAQDLWVFYLFAMVYGLGFGGTSPVMAALVGDTFGLGELGAILGMLEVGFGVGAAIGPAIGGYIFDVSRSYFLAFLSGAVAMLIVALLIALIKRETNRNFISK